MDSSPESLIQDEWRPELEQVHASPLGHVPDYDGLIDRGYVIETCTIGGGVAMSASSTERDKAACVVASSAPSGGVDYVGVVIPSLPQDQAQVRGG